jgi:hypothetical protein
MDKTLNRPLFKKRAQEIHQQVNPKQVPKFFLGGIMSAGSMIRAGAMPAYRYLSNKAGQAFANPTVRTGLTGLEAGYAGQGINEMAQGLSEGDMSQAAMGASMAIPGMAFLPKTAAGSGIKALRESGEYAMDRTTDLTKLLYRNPGKTAIGSVAGTAGFGMMDDEAVAQIKPAEMSNEDYAKDIQERLIYQEKPKYEPDPKKRVTENLKEYKESTKDFKPYVIGIENPLTEGEKALDAQLKTVAKVKEVASKLGVNPNEATDEQLKQIAIESNVDLSTLQSMVGQRDEGAVTADNMPAPNNDGVPIITGNEGPAEIQHMIEKRKRDVAAGNELAGTDALSGQFLQFKNQINKMTGSDNSNLNNLLMMRAAGQMLSGKSPEKGIRGFLDITGQTLASSADAMIGLKLKQQDSDMKLAQAFLKMKSDKAKGAGMLTGGDKTVRVSDPSVPGGFRNVRVSLGKDNKYYTRQYDPNTGQQSFSAANFTGTDVKEDPDKQNKALMGLEDNRRGGKMVEFVIKNAGEGGTKAALGLLTEDAFGTLDFFAGGNVGGDSSVIDDQIRAEMAQTTGREGFDISGGKVNIFAKESDNMTKRFNADLENAKENGAEQVEKQLKKAGIIAKNYRPTEDELRNYTRLALIEQRMKYIVANANKSEDRLTQKDIDNAAKRTQIIKYITSPRTIRLNYEQLREEFAEKAGSYLSQFKLNGGEESYIQDNFMDIPGVALQYERKNKDFMRNQKVNNQVSRQDILNTIQIGG